MPKGGVTIKIETDFKKLHSLIENLKGKPVRILHDGVSYGAHNEFGTSRMPPHPFMTPAIEAVRPAFNKGWPQVIEKQALTAEAFVEKIARDAEGHAKANAPVLTGALKNSISVSTPEEFGAG